MKAKKKTDETDLREELDLAKKACNKEFEDFGMTGTDLHLATIHKIDELMDELHSSTKKRRKC